MGYTDKRATEALGRNLEALAACREAGERPDRELTAWIEGLPAEMRERLAKYGLIDPEQAHAAKPLLEHLADYEADMKAKGRTLQHVGQEITKIKRMIKGCRFPCAAAQLHHQPGPERRASIGGAVAGTAF